MSSQQFCLKWNNHTNNMLNVFESLLATEALVDVTLACDGLSLKAHKMVLSACSPFFQSLFLENPCKHPIVIMKDMSYKDLKAIIDFMYRGEVNVSQDQLSALLKTAETLKVKGLAEVSGENRQSSGVVQQEITTQQSSTPTHTQQSGRSDSPPLHGKRKRGRPRKRSLSDSNRSDDDVVPSKIKDPESPEIEELSGDASMEATDSLRQGSNSSSQSQVHHSSSVNFLSSNHRQSVSSHQNAHVEELPSGDDNEFEVEPHKLLEQTLTTDNVPSISNANASLTSGHFNLPSSSGIEISQIGMGDSQALVPVSATSDSLSSGHMQGPDSPQDIKPAILTFEEPSSPIAGPSHQSERSMMMYMDQSSMPGPSNFQDQSLVQHDSQPQGESSSTPKETRSSFSFETFQPSSGEFSLTLREMKSPFSSETFQQRSDNGNKSLVETFQPCPDNRNKPMMHQCQFCSYSTEYKHNLSSHTIRKHSDVRPHTCPTCHKGFVTAIELTKHQRVHSKSLICEICQMRCETKMLYFLHKQMHFQ